MKTIVWRILCLLHQVRAGKWSLQSCGDRFVSGFLITGHAKFSLRNHACFDFRFALCSLWFGSSQSKWFFDVPHWQVGKISSFLSTILQVGKVSKRFGTLLYISWRQLEVFICQFVSIQVKSFITVARAIAKQEALHEYLEV